MFFSIFSQFLLEINDRLLTSSCFGWVDDSFTQNIAKQQMLTLQKLDPDNVRHFSVCFAWKRHISEHQNYNFDLKMMGKCLVLFSTQSFSIYCHRGGNKPGNIHIKKPESEKFYFLFPKTNWNYSNNWSSNRLSSPLNPTWHLTV